MYSNQDRQHGFVSPAEQVRTMGNKHTKHEYPRRGDTVFVPSGYWTVNEVTDERTWHNDPSKLSHGQVIHVDNSQEEATVQFRRTRWTAENVVLIQRIAYSHFYGNWKSESRRFVLSADVLS